MRKYRFEYKQYIFYIVPFFLVIPFLFIKNIVIFKYLIIIVTLKHCLNVLDMIFFMNITISDKGITSNAFARSTFIEWDKIYNVRIHSPKFHKYSILITNRSESKIIGIDDWTQDSKELIKIVVDECKKRNIYIDSNIEKIIEE